MNVKIIRIKLGTTSAFLVKGEKNILVDTGNPGDADRILKWAAGYYINPDDISLIVITHCHQDHAGSAADLKELTGADLLIHHNEARFLREGRNALLETDMLFGRILKRLIRQKPVKPVTPDITFDEKYDLSQYGINGFLLFTPGHTEGSISLVIPGESAIIGDLLMKLMPFTKKPALPPFACNRTLVQESLRKVLKHSPGDIYLSHGGHFPVSCVKKLLK